MFKRMGIRGRLFSLVGFAVLNVLMVGAVSGIYLKKVMNSYGHIMNVNVKSLRAINEARNAQRSIVILISNIVATGRPVEDLEKAKTDFEKSSKAYTAATEEYSSLPPADGEAEIRTSVDKGWKMFVDASKKILDIAGSSLPKDLAARTEIDSHELAEGRKQFRESFQALTDFHDREMKHWSELSAEVATLANRINLCVILIGCLITIVFGLKTSIGLSNSLSVISKKIFDAMGSASSIGKKISTTSMGLSSSSVEQSSSLQETASSMEEVSTMVNKNAGNAQHTCTIVQESKDRVVKGQEAVLDMVGAIGEIGKSNEQLAGQIDRSNQEIKEIVKLIDEIKNTTQVINDIVFQTKLLSFNASVEAARAGESGKGFAVVAEEVGNLAQLSGKAANEISRRLAESVTRVGQIIEKSSSQTATLLHDNKGKLANGVDIAERCRTLLDGLVDNITRVNEMASEISVASGEQSQGVAQINTAISQLDAVGHRTSNVAEELASASKSLVQETDTLYLVVKELSELVDGTGGTQPRPGPQAQSPDETSHEELLAA